MKKELPLIPLFELFIKDCRKGKRRRPDGQRIKEATIENYTYTLNLLRAFENTGFNLRIRPQYSKDKRVYIVERNYWKKFYRRFVDFVQKEKHCYDNYTGHVIKNIKVFFKYINAEKLIPTGDFYKYFYVMHEEVPIITLDPEQLKFLINDKEFDQKLPEKLRITKQIFIFGCTVALRFSDLFNIRFRDIQMVNGYYFLTVTAIKTDIVTTIRLPDYAMNIIQQANARITKNNVDKIFPSVCLSEFNSRLRELGVLAGWTTELGKTRKQAGKSIEQTYRHTHAYRFCDLLSSHVMRRTAISTMLILGVSENIVRNISGHKAGSKSFFRYVNFNNAYTNTEMDKVSKFFRN